MAKRAANSEPTEAKRALYPYYGLSKCLEVATAVRDIGNGRTEVPASVLAEHLEVEDTSPAFKQIVTSTKAFTLIVGWGKYGLTDAGMEYFFPTDEGQRRRAILKAVKAPAIFDKLISRFDGSRLPTNDLLANIMHREYGVPTSWAPRVAPLFVNSLRHLNLIDPTGVLRYESAMHTAGSSPAENGTTEAQAASPVPAVTAKPAQAAAIPAAQPDALSTDWSYRTRDGWVQLRTSDELTHELWERLRRYVDVLKPPDGKEAP